MSDVQGELADVFHPGDVFGERSGLGWLRRRFRRRLKLANLRCDLACVVSGLAAWIVDLVRPLFCESHKTIVELLDFSVLRPDDVVQRLHLFQLRSASVTGRGQGLLSVVGWPEV